MAESDGSLRIQVDLDTKGFKIGVKDLEWAAKRTADKISAIGDEASVSLKKQIDVLSELSDGYKKQERKVEQLKEKLKELSEQKIETEQYKKLSAELEDLMKKKTELTNKKEAWIDLGFSEADVDRRLAGLNEIRTAIEKLEDQKRKLEESGEAWLLPDVSSISQKLEDEQKKLEKLRQKEDAAIRGADHLYETFKNSEYSDRHIADDSKNLRWLKERQEELSKAGVGPGYKEYDRNVIAIHTLSEELKEYEKIW